ARKLVLDPKMLAMMPEQWKTQWNNFLPAGEVDLDAVLTFDGTTWQQQVTMNCLNVGFTYHRFPYRFERGRGKLELRNKNLTFQLTALSNTEEMRFIGDFELNGPKTHGWTDIRGDGIRIDERLLRAIPETMQPLARSMHPQGRFNVAMRLWKEAPGEGPMRKRIVLGFQDCFVRYDKFPYPISGVSGTVEVQDDFWVFHDDLRGTNDTGKITCRGQLTPSPEGSELILTFHGDNVRIDEELRDALNPGAQRLWNDMKPRGMLKIDSEVRYRLSDKTLHTTVRAEPIEDTVSIEPTYFPYRMEKLHGTFTLADGRLQMEKLRAEHGRTELSAVGECLVDPNGGWRLRLERVFVDRLAVDRDLLNALPEQLKKATSSLEPTGAFNVRGALTLAGSGVPGRPLSSDWNLTIDCHDNSLRCGIDLRGIFGSVSVAGRSEGGRFESTGELNLDSISYADYQVTEVLGPLWIDNEQVLLGMWADRRKGEQAERHVTGKLYGGTTVADGWIVLGDEPEYAFLATLTNGNLSRFAQEHIAGNNKLSGEILATVDLRGKGRTRNNLQGRGSIQLRNADIYQLPAMVSLLKVLSLRAPDATGFTKSDINFVLQGEHAYLERIDFDGDAVSLQGRGELNLLNDQINLVFRTVVGSDSARLPAVKQLLGGASQQILLLHVDGTLKSPQVRREAFPGVNQVLEQLQAELNSPSPLRLSEGPTRVSPPGRYPLDRN
ncbi:MAG: AsmA-like C-terminal region-containing protein, partial [Planctomycetia bacterium]|nr:AsmA-like C-terminal region-containing protein [Planctomycetia bacterium]